MIAVNIGDVIESYIYPGRKLRVLELGTDYPPKQAPCPTVRVELYYGEELREACFALSTVTRNFSTDGCNDPRVPNPKYRYATRFNGYEIDLGAETLSELYALMAAAGVKFKPVANPSAATLPEPMQVKTGAELVAVRHAIFQYARACGCEIDADGFGIHVREAMDSPHVHLPPGPIPPRTTMFVADEAQPVGATFDWNAFYEPRSTNSPDPVAEAFREIDDDTDPQPTVVGS